MDTGWSRGDLIAAWSLGIALLGAAGTWLALPQIQEWRAKKARNDEPITLGSLANATSYNPPLAPGVVRADRHTLDVLLTSFAVVDWDWLRTYDFGGSFQYSAIERIQLYAMQHSGPSDEFIDVELEKLRSTLIASTLKFGQTAVRNTIVLFRGEDDQTRKIPDRFDNEHNDARFFRSSDEINKAAGVVCAAYDTLVRRARLKLALAEEGNP
jgi:hypothetical protein